MSQLDRTIDFFSPFPAFIASSCTIKTNPREGVFQSRSSSNSVSKAHGIFSNMDLLSISGTQPRAAAIANIVWGVSWNPLTNNSKGDLSYLVLFFFLLDTLQFSRGILSPKVT